MLIVLLQLCQDYGLAEFFWDFIHVPSGFWLHFLCVLHGNSSKLVFYWIAYMGCHIYQGEENLGYILPSWLSTRIYACMYIPQVCISMICHFRLQGDVATPNIVLLFATATHWTLELCIASSINLGPWQMWNMLTSNIYRPCKMMMLGNFEICSND